MIDLDFARAWFFFGFKLVLAVGLLPELLFCVARALYSAVKGGADSESRLDGGED